MKQRRRSSMLTDSKKVWRPKGGRKETRSAGVCVGQRAGGNEVETEEQKESWRRKPHSPPTMSYP